jgi:indole-3-glycerol phosphate synthase
LDRVVVAESGIRTRQDVKRMVNAGVSALLIGETIMRSEDIATAVKVLAGEYI